MLAQVSGGLQSRRPRGLWSHLCPSGAGGSRSSPRGPLQRVLECPHGLAQPFPEKQPRKECSGAWVSMSSSVRHIPLRRPLCPGHTAHPDTLWGDETGTRTPAAGNPCAPWQLAMEMAGPVTVRIKEDVAHKLVNLVLAHVKVTGTKSKVRASCVFHCESLLLLLLPLLVLSIYQRLQHRSKCDSSQTMPPCGRGTPTSNAGALHLVVDRGPWEFQTLVILTKRGPP